MPVLVYRAGYAFRHTVYDVGGVPLKQNKALLDVGV